MSSSFALGQPKNNVNNADCYAFLFISALSDASIAVICTFTLNNIHVHKYCCFFCFEGAVITGISYRLSKKMEIYGYMHGHFASCITSKNKFKPAALGICHINIPRLAPVLILVIHEVHIRLHFQVTGWIPHTDPQFHQVRLGVSLRIP